MSVLLWTCVPWVQVKELERQREVESEVHEQGMLFLDRKRQKLLEEIASWEER